MSKAVVPRKDLSHNLGTRVKRWGTVHAGTVNAETVHAGIVEASEAAGGLKADIDSRAHNWFELKRNKAYTVGDIVYSPHLPLWAYLECTKAGTTAAGEPAFTGVYENQTVADGTAVFAVRRITTAKKLGTATVGSQDLPVYLNNGTIMPCVTSLASLATDVAKLKNDLATAGGIASESVGANGFCKLKSGLILQWGVTQYVINNPSFPAGTYKVIFPITFPNSVYTIVITRTSLIEGYLGVSNVTRSGFETRKGVHTADEGFWDYTIPCWYIAIGM